MAAHPNQLRALRAHAFKPGESGNPEGGRIVALRERKAAAKADAIIAALDRVSGDTLDSVMRDLAKAIAASARRQRFLLLALLDRFWPIKGVEDEGAGFEGPYTEPFDTTAEGSHQELINRLSELQLREQQRRLTADEANRLLIDQHAV